MPLELNKISSFQLDTLPKSKCVFFFPVGPIEDHGPHLPLGLDLDEANRLCFVAAQHLEEELKGWIGVIMPTAPLGIDANTNRIAITVRPHVLRDWLVDSCRSLMRAGFIHFVCFSGHLGPKQLTAFEEAGKIVRRAGLFGRWGLRLRGLGGMGGIGIDGLGRPSLISASSALSSPKQVFESPFWLDPKEHGGKRDTSVALVISADSVSSQYKSLPKLDREYSKWIRNWNRRRGLHTGYWGDPSKADEESGEKEILNTLDHVFPKMRAVWEGSNPNFLFRSWYSILPPNKSFFKAWLLVLMIVLFIGGWAYIISSSLDVK
jgi:creatinine amidohydrolase